MSISYKNTIYRNKKIWSINDGLNLQTLLKGSYALCSIVVSYDNWYCLTGPNADDVWKYKSMPVFCLRGLPVDVIISPNKNYLISKFSNEEFQIYDTIRNENRSLLKQPVSLIPWHIGQIDLIGFSSDSKYYLVCRDNYTIEQHDVDSDVCKSSINIPVQGYERIIWKHPFLASEDGAKLEIMKIEFKDTIDKISIVSVSTIYNINEIHLNGCNFHDIIASDLTKTFLYQYGAKLN